MNPLNNSPTNLMLQFLNNGGNPRQFAEQLVQQNPQAKQFMEQFRNLPQGQNPKDIAMQLAQQRGIDINQLMQIAHRMGLK